MQDPGATRAESLLAAHDLPAARRAAEQLVRERPRDAGAHLLLGRVWLAWPTVGRYDAVTQFRTAARLAPGDPEPLYRQAEAGFRLGSDAPARRWASRSRRAPTRSPRRGSPGGRRPSPPCPGTPRPASPAARPPPRPPGA